MITRFKNILLFTECIIDHNALHRVPLSERRHNIIDCFLITNSHGTFLCWSVIMKIKIELIETVCYCLNNCLHCSLIIMATRTTNVDFYKKNKFFTCQVFSVHINTLTYGLSYIIRYIFSSFFFLIIALDYASCNYSKIK